MKTHALLLSFVVLAACSGGQGTAPANQSDNAGTSTVTTPQQIALETAAADTGLSVDELTVGDSEAVEFSDSSLGCPQPGMAYLQVITPGHKVIVVTPTGARLDVRVTGNHSLICKPQVNNKTQR